MEIYPAAGTIADVEDLVVIGSQAVPGEFPNAPAELLVSNDADVFFFTRALARHAMVRRELLDRRLAAMDLAPEVRSLAAGRYRRTLPEAEVQLANRQPPQRYVRMTLCSGSAPEGPIPLE